VLNIKKSQKYLLGAAAVASSVMLMKLMAIPSNPPTTSKALPHSPDIATHIAQLLPAQSPPAPSQLITTRPTPPLTTAARVQPLPASPSQPQLTNIKQQWSVDSHHQGYQVAVPTNNAIARQYDEIAQKTGYLEQYPEISRTELTEYQGQRLSKDAATAFRQMQQAAAQAGISLRIISGFRSIRTQNQIFTGKGGGVQAAEYSAPPGHSQHHTGLAVDINSLSPKFRETAAFRWLSRHGAAYGFMLPYAHSRGDLGPQAEPWHWVYVAKKPAMQLMTNFIDRARQHQHNPLLGNQQLEKIYHSATPLTVQVPNKSKS
jgi:zinc D-Ala-D-Ala carboxypeptidase